MMLHQSKSEKPGVTLAKLVAVFTSISVEFHQNPLYLHIFTSGLPAELLWNTALKFQ